MAWTDDDKQWLETLLDKKLTALEARVDEKFDVKLERLETKLLTSFHQWASPVEAKIRKHRESLRALDLGEDLLLSSLSELQERVAKLEGQKS